MSSEKIKTAYRLLKKRQLKDFCKLIYTCLPNNIKSVLLPLVLKFRPQWFNMFSTVDYEQIQGNGVELKDVSTQAIKNNLTVGSIAIHCHIYYDDLVPEFVEQLANMPFDFDLYISVKDQNGKDKCEAFRSIHALKQLTVKIVPNRGRDIAPMFVDFGSALQNYNYIAHIQTKKSLYNKGATVGWREYLVSALFGSRDNIEKIFTIFENDKVGIIYPQSFQIVPYMGFTWLANKSIGEEICHKLDIDCPNDYFNFPAGSMFWARMDALRPLFALNFQLDDFTAEAGQTDGTTAHAIERLLGVVPTALGYEHVVIKDLIKPSNSTYRLDQQYFPRDMDLLKKTIDSELYKVIAFDIFDTLLTRPLLEPEHIKKIVAERLDENSQKLYVQYRQQAESQAREKLQMDVTLSEIYAEFKSLANLSDAETLLIQAMEESIECSSVNVKFEVKELFDYAKSLRNKKIILIGDTHLSSEIISEMLVAEGIIGWDSLYLSSEQRCGKATGNLYEKVLADQGITGSELLMIGDDEYLDVQIPRDMYKSAYMHLMRDDSLAMVSPTYFNVLSNIDWRTDLNKELTIGLLVQKNLSKVASISKDDLSLFTNNAYSIGYNVVGPIVASFSAWLHNQSQKDKDECIYNIAEKDKFLSEAYQMWCLDSCAKSDVISVLKKDAFQSYLVEQGFTEDSNQIMFHLKDLLSLDQDQFNITSEVDLRAIKQGCFDFINDSVKIRNEVHNSFMPSSEVAAYLYLEMLKDCHNQDAHFLYSLISENT